MGKKKNDRGHWNVKEILTSQEMVSSLCTRVLPDCRSPRPSDLNVLMRIRANKWPPLRWFIALIIGQFVKWGEQRDLRLSLANLVFFGI